MSSGGTHEAVGAYRNIPLELRERRQWVCWRYEQVEHGKQTKVPYAPDGSRRASVTDPATWGDFETVVRTRGALHLDGIGFVLSASDPYCIIDLDNKPERPLSEDECGVHKRILAAFGSYTERSVSGRGYHIVIRGSMSRGRRQGNVEVYSADRYMCFTGDVVRDAPIVDCQQYLDELVSGMPEPGVSVELDEVDAIMNDVEVHEMAMRAANGDKYGQLYRGDWEAMGYTSQSEADFALLAILAYYSRDNEQVRRLFRNSSLGKRNKTTRNDRYLNLTLSKVRAKQPSPTDFAQAKANAERMMAAAHAEALPAVGVAPEPAVCAPVGVAPPPPVANAPAHVSLPPGFVGELAKYFHSTAIRPLWESAIIGAIATVAGVVGRNYNISGTGLNQYLLFVAPTGTGKEAIETGMTGLLRATRPSIPMIEDYVGPGAFASGQALIRKLDKHPCFVSVLGEFGLTLQSLSDPRASGAVVMLRKVLLDLYGKSGWNSMLHSTAYSDIEKNTKNVHAPALTIIGECTPETFYDAIDGGDIADGLVPRFHIVEYTGARPKRNRNAFHDPSQDLVKKFAQLAATAITMQNNHSCANVQIGAEGLAMLDAFDDACDEQINNSRSVGEKQLWNRAHLKALKLAGLLAVGCDPYAPVVTAEVAQWAIEFTRTGTEQVLKRFEIGDVGKGEQKQFSELRRVVGEYFKESTKTLERYKCKPEMQKAGIIPYAYFLARLSRVASFYKDRQGAARALRSVLDNMVEAEILEKLSLSEAQSRFNARQALYCTGSGW